ncbi:Phage capsid family protein [Symmachiella macrocystis]|uniref:Phage capsid family protein n=1 Tax=Symmachiella macrocystis TaxID=2527985 RepID=A0A5C6BEF8_9PLAN|nr:phage major capsid protein [Symmachiella macrocystis]TWU08844.1 Phage capsid family protein [Symmachiella macrocystis]
MVTLNLKGMYEERELLLDEAKHINAKAQREGRELTASEATRIDEILDVEIPPLSKGIERQNKLDHAIAGPNYQPFISNSDVDDCDGLVLARRPIDTDDDDRSTSRVQSATAKPTQWMNKETGKPIRVMVRGDKLHKPTDREPLSLGRFMAAKISGNWKYAQREMQAAQKEGDNSLGGVLVPSELSRILIDKARERSVMSRLGMLAIPMENETLRIARISSDPTISMVGENETIPESEVKFDSVLFTARKSACIVPTSREVNDDAVNFAQILEETMINAMATDMDRQMLIGSLGTEMTGLVENANINETGSIGAIANDDIHDAVIAVMGRNEMPTGYCAAAEIIGDLLKEKASTAGSYLGPSPLVAPLQREHTEHLTTANALIGDFSKCAMGIRTQVEVATDEGGTYFQKYQRAFRIVVRWDFAVLRADAFQRLAGITT